MNAFPAIQRRSLIRLAPVTSLLLVVALFIGGAHHHAEGAAPHACAVCSAGHAHAATAAAAPDPHAPLRQPGAVFSPPANEPRQGPTAAANSRAPPVA